MARLCRSFASEWPGTGIARWRDAAKRVGSLGNECAGWSTAGCLLPAGVILIPCAARGSLPEAGAQCGSPARWDLCRRSWATMIPSPTVSSVAPGGRQAGMSCPCNICSNARICQVAGLSSPPPRIPPGRYRLSLPDSGPKSNGCLLRLRLTRCFRDAWWKARHKAWIQIRSAYTWSRLTHTDPDPRRIRCRWHISRRCANVC